MGDVTKGLRIMSDEALPVITVITPTWNRAGYLERVWQGLAAQTYRYFEWIVCDDGSNDDTQAVLAKLTASSWFPITVVTADIHVGKARMDNEAIALARGALILWNDSDDVLLPHAISTLVEAWNAIPQLERSAYVGVTALCATQAGVVSSQLPQSGGFDASWNELRETFQVTGDMVYCTRAEVLKAHPFPEVDFVVPEGIVWTTIGDMATRICPIVVKTVEYGATHCISFSNKMEYCRGRAYAIAVGERNLRRYRKSWPSRIWNLTTYLRCSQHGEMPLSLVRQLWAGNSPAWMLYLLLPVSWAFVCKDRIQGKVRKTHREFDRAASMANISATSFTGQPAARGAE